MFTGMYVSGVYENKCDFPFGNKGEIFAVICVEDITGEIYVKVIPEESADKMEFEGKILEVYEHEIKEASLPLPQRFIEYLENDDAVILGVGHAVDIVASRDYEASLNNLDKILDDLDF